VLVPIMYRLLEGETIAMPCFMQQFFTYRAIELLLEPFFNRDVRTLIEMFLTSTYL
jgi:hypothetical protein